MEVNPSLCFSPLGGHVGKSHLHWRSFEVFICPKVMIEVVASETLLGCLPCVYKLLMECTSRPRSSCAVKVTEIRGRSS